MKGDLLGYPMVMGYFRSSLRAAVGIDAYRAMQRGRRCRLRRAQLVYLM